MTSQDNRSKHAADLRKKADKIARDEAARTAHDSAALSPEDILKTLHELRVHQIELELQNEELRQSQAAVQESQALYFDLYNLAPVGYLTLSEQGLILEINLTASTLLGETRAMLVKQPIYRFILKEDQDIYYLHCKKLFETGTPQECELRLMKPDGVLFWVHLTTNATQAENGSPLCRVVLTDITERKQMEQALHESEEKFRTMSDFSADWDYWLASDGHFVYISPSCEYVAARPWEKAGKTKEKYAEMLN